MAEILDDKLSKSVIRFLQMRWIAAFGPPRTLVYDQGREFVSWEMEEFASSHSIHLHHIAVQAPWQNGVAERSGGILKTSVAAYNGDVNESGSSPYQATIGRQPRMLCDVLGGIQSDSVKIG